MLTSYCDVYVHMYTLVLQECLWLNSLLCHIRQTIHKLHTSLIGGPGALPWELKDIVHSLNKEQVPAAWVHPNCQPSTHSLASWVLGELFMDTLEFVMW